MHAPHSIYDERPRYLKVLVESLQEKQRVIIGTLRDARVEAHDARDGSVVTYVRYEALQQDEGHKRTSCDDVSYLMLQVLAKHHDGSLLRGRRLIVFLSFSMAYLVGGDRLLFSDGKEQETS